VADFTRTILLEVEIDSRRARQELEGLRRESDSLTEANRTLAQATGQTEDGFGGLSGVVRELRLELKAMSTGLDVVEVAAQDGNGSLGRLSAGMSVLRAVTMGATTAGRQMLSSLASVGASAASAALPVAGLTLGLGTLALAFAALATGGLVVSIRGLSDFIGHSTRAGQEAQRLADAVTAADQRLSAAIGKVAYDTANLDQVSKALYVMLTNLANVTEESGQTFIDFSLGMAPGVREGLVFLGVLDKIQEQSSLLGGAIQTLALGPFGALRSSTQELSRLFDLGVTQADRYAEALERLRQTALALSPTLASVGAGGVGQIGDLSGTSVDLGRAQRAFREGLIDSRKRPEASGKAREADAGPLAKGVVGTITGAAGSDGVTGQVGLVATLDEIRNRMASIKQEAIDTFSQVQTSMDEAARSNAASQMSKNLEEQARQWDLLKSSVANAAAGFVTSSAQIVGALAGQGGAWKALQANALRALGNLAAQMGSFFLLAGIGSESLGFFGLQGAGAIGAGIGLIALGAALSGVGAFVGREEKRTQGRQATSLNSRSADAYKPAFQKTEDRDTTIILEIDGQKIGKALARPLREMAELGHLQLATR